MTAFSPPTPQPAATRDGAPLAPLAGGFLPPYTDRLALIERLPAPTPTDPDQGATPFSGEAAQAMSAWMQPFGPAEPTCALAQERTIEGPHGPIPIRVYTPAPGGQVDRPVPAGTALVWMHGGAFVAGDLDMPENDLVARGLVTRTGAVVVSVDYHLCTGGIHHPVPHDDVLAAYRWVGGHAAELGVDPTRIAVGGASAGGNLAAGLALHATADGDAPWQALLVYPVLHAEHWPAPSQELAERLLTMPQSLRFLPEMMAGLNTTYLGGPVHDVDPCAFPGETSDRKRLEAFPPTYIENCENDDLRASGEAFARQLAAAGADVEVVTCAGVPHGHLNAVGSPLTAASLERLAARLRRP
ncbi:alpha/beta hydrolase [Actinomyces oricola]